MIDSEQTHSNCFPWWLNILLRRKFSTSQKHSTLSTPLQTHQEDCRPTETSPPDILNSASQHSHWPNGTVEDRNKVPKFEAKCLALHKEVFFDHSKNFSSKFAIFHWTSCSDYVDID
uniref:Uncharacterized protein n=1 Tax=Cacopsylla melanoneura TaxID=428564 RepID=A0A8D8SPB4_9HEMI